MTRSVLVFVAAVVMMKTLLRAQEPGVPFVPIDGVVNGANFLPGCAPNGGVAQGALFTVLGREIGPPALERVTRFPLETSLGGVSIRVSIAGASVDAWPLYVTATQVGAILPSRTPTGDGTLTLTYRGRASAAVPIRVRSSAPGLFTVNQRGTGPAAVENVAATGETVLNVADRPLRPGQLAIAWGTGLGAVQGNEASGPLPGDLASLDTRVWIGNERARVVYRGRSGCCAGIDQIVFETPARVEGCQVPFAVEAGGVWSNFGSVAVSATGDCRPVRRPPPVQAVDRYGLIMFLDGFGSVLLPSALDDWIRLGFFQRGRVEGDVEADLNAFEPNVEQPVGSCAVRYGTDFPARPSQPNQSAMDAGAAIAVSGPGGVFRLEQNPVNLGRYEDPRRVAIPAGRYRIDNGSGGRDVGAFNFDADLVTMRLLTPGETIRRDQDLPVTWEYSGPADRLITIFGSTRLTCGGGLVSFSCVARAADRRFVVPARILSLIPPSTSFLGISNGAFNISSTPPGGVRRIFVPGLDLALFLQLSISAVRPTFE